VDQLKKAQVHREIFPGDPAVRVQTGVQQRPYALDRVDVDFMEAITILVAGVFSAPPAGAVVLVAPAGKRA
jgi:hypothetical protein